MRRFVAALAGSMLTLIAAAGPAAADVQRLAIKDPGYVSNVCSVGDAAVCGSGPTSQLATVEVSIKCPVGEAYTLVVTLKQGDTTEGMTQQGGDCTGTAQQRYVNIVPSSGSFEPGRAKAKASASSTPGAQAGTGAFQANVDRRITLVKGGPPCC